MPPPLSTAVKSFLGWTRIFLSLIFIEKWNPNLKCRFHRLIRWIFNCLIINFQHLWQIWNYNWIVWILNWFHVRGNHILPSLRCIVYSPTATVSVALYMKEAVGPSQIGRMGRSMDIDKNKRHFGGLWLQLLVVVPFAMTIIIYRLLVGKNYSLMPRNLHAEY